MKIKSISWNPRVMDVTHIGDKTGTKFVQSKAEVSEFGRERVEKIEEISLNIYEIHYLEFNKRSILRIFNPCEVLFDCTSV